MISHSLVVVAARRSWSWAAATTALLLCPLVLVVALPKGWAFQQEQGASSLSAWHRQEAGGSGQTAESCALSLPSLPCLHRTSTAVAAKWTTSHRRRRPFVSPTLFMSSSGSPADEEGADLAAEFFKMAQQKGINLDPRDILDDEDEDEEDDDDEEVEDDEPEPNIPQGAINAFLGYETVDVGEKLAGNVSLTDRQLYSEVKERVLDTAGGFVDFVKAARDDDDDEDDNDDEEDGSGANKPYEVPTTVPDSDLTAGEVVILVLNALLNNNMPTPNKGVEILFGYSSEGSQIKNEVGLTPTDYAEFLKETEYKVLFSHLGASIDKADYSFDGKKAFFTARLKTGPGPLDVVSVNFILSTKGVDDDACWLVDSMLIRPQSMRRRRRR